MRLKTLKKMMLVPDKEYILNKTINIQGQEILILSFTVEKDENCLWTISEREDFIREDSNDEEGYHHEFKTNRERLINSIEMSRRDRSVFIKEMQIQDQIIKFTSSSSSHISYNNPEGMMKLQHFVEKGLISEEWDEVRLENIVITEYQQMEGEDTPVIHMDRELNISLKFDQRFKKIPIHHPFKLQFGKQNMGTKIEYYDEEMEENKYFFINEIYSFDPYEEIMNNMENIEDPEMRKNILDNFIESLEGTCPRDKNLAVIKYETPDNIQLSFNMKEYLDAKPIISSSASGIIWSSGEDELGVNGYKVRECVLQPIDRDYEGEIQLELTSRFLQIPGEKINI